MGIKNYLGPFDKKGNVINRTVAVCECESCGYVWHAQYKTAKIYNEFCRTCISFGSPVPPSDIFDLYEEIVEIHELSVRGGVTNNTIVSVHCYGCDSVYDMPFRNVKKVSTKDSPWRCQPCAQIDRYNDTVIYPIDVPDSVLSINVDTLGHRGQIKNNTEVLVRCEICDKKFYKYWMNFDPNGNSCNSCVMTLKWKYDNEYTENVLNGIQNSLSSGHEQLKRMMIEYGITGFESEQPVAQYRVDELNKETKTVIEYFGSYWHADPRVYGEDHEIRDGLFAKDIWNRDRIKIDSLASLGYKVVIVWERDFLENPVGIIEGLANIIGNPVKLGEYEK